LVSSRILRMFPSGTDSRSVTPACSSGLGCTCTIPSLVKGSSKLKGPIRPPSPAHPDVKTILTNMKTKAFSINTTFGKSEFRLSHNKHNRAQNSKRSA